MNELDSNPHFILDANFFIALKEIKAHRPYYYLSMAKSKLDIHLYVSNAILNEIPFIRSHGYKDFSKGVEVIQTTEKELGQVKKDLQKNRVRLMAQDPDLTLVALGKRIKDENPKADVFVVSDDFKLSKNIDSIGYRMKGLPLPSFLLLLAQNLRGEVQSYWKIIRKQVLKLNLDFMMSRSEIYAPQAKIAWLIENAVNVAGDGIQLTQDEEKQDQDKNQEELSENKKLTKICEDFILGRPLSKTKKSLIAPYETALKRVKKSRSVLEEAKYALMNSEYENSIKSLQKAREYLYHSLQLLGSGNMPEREYQFIEKILASEITKITFLKSFVYIEANKIGSAINSLDETAIFATIARLSNTVLTINYIKALVYVFNSLYNRSVSQFKFIHSLAHNYSDLNLIFKAAIGESIILYLTGNREEALTIAKNVGDNIKEKEFPHLMIALIDSGNYFLAIGFPEVATNLYTKALELAIDGNQKWKIRVILDKMKKSFMAGTLASTESKPSYDITALVNNFHELKGINEFNEEMVKFVSFTNILYESFEYFSTKKQSIKGYYDLPEEMRGDWQCVKFYKPDSKNHTVIVCYNEKMGLIGFDVVLDEHLIGIPENFVIQIKKTAKIRIMPPDDSKLEHLLCRAIIPIKNEARDIEIKKSIPIFFQQMKVGA